jgi:hypothetical protein
MFPLLTRLSVSGLGKVWTCGGGRDSGETGAEKSLDGAGSEDLEITVNTVQYLKMITTLSATVVLVLTSVPYFLAFPF